MTQYRHSMNLLETSGAPTLADMRVAKQVAEVLIREYPGYAWAVSCDHEQGMLDIRAIDLIGSHGYRLHLRGANAGTYSASELERRAKMAAGQILERFAVRRGAKDEDEIAGLMRDRLGRIKGEID